jgi:hypothetical protein
MKNVIIQNLYAEFDQMIKSLTGTHLQLGQRPRLAICLAATTAKKPGYFVKTMGSGVGFSTHRLGRAEHRTTSP